MATSTTRSRITMRIWSRSGSNRPSEGWTVSTDRAIVLAGAGRREGWSVVMAKSRGSLGGARRFLLAIGVDIERFRPLLRRFLVDHDFGDAGLARQLVHRLEQDAFHDRAQAAGAGLPFDGA